MPTISTLGVGSGLDLSGLLDQLENAERGKLNPIVAQKTEANNKISAYGQLKSALSQLQAAAEKLSNANHSPSQVATYRIVLPILGSDPR